ncbi:MAG: hypothetical protein ACTSPB_16455 [Candidatus Thorarchaeota archaeon]
MLTFSSKLFAKKISPEGSLYLGLLSTRVVTTAFLELLIDALQTSTDLSIFKYHASGTGTTDAAAADTALEAEVGTRVAGTQEENGSTTYKSVATLQYTSANSVTEHGIFSAANAGTLLDRSVFTAIDVNNGDQIEFTYLLQVAECAVIETQTIEAEEIEEEELIACDFPTLLALVETLEHYLKTISPSVYVQGTQDTVKDPSLTERQFHDLDTKIKPLQDYDVARRNLDIMKNRLRAKKGKLAR